MDGAVSHVISHNTSAVFTFHNEIKREILNEEYAIISECSAEEGVKHRMTSAISDSAAAICLTAMTKILRLSSKGSLIDFTLFSSAKWHTVGFKLENRLWSLFGHVVDSVLISEPITTFDSVVKMPSPIVRMHVSECGINTTLIKRVNV